ncbi:Hypothetical protein CINCED_3A022702 [Cinara cedri]|uniref:Uncharacterized protein n=1 Tax=Cinara cedri TaxID=506608 RepID=A0A5E4N1G6_9HEMI|nr:Hypothetical protein CINCED_3A022702 [Cinara cedri]
MILPYEKSKLYYAYTLIVSLRLNEGSNTTFDADKTCLSVSSIVPFGWSTSLSPITVTRDGDFLTLDTRDSSPQNQSTGNSSPLAATNISTRFWATKSPTVVAVRYQSEFRSSAVDRYRIPRRAYSDFLALSTSTTVSFRKPPCSKLHFTTIPFLSKGRTVRRFGR